MHSGKIRPTLFVEPALHRASGGAAICFRMSTDGTAAVAGESERDQSVWLFERTGMAAKRAYITPRKAEIWMMRAWNRRPVAAAWIGSPRTRVVGCRRANENFLRAHWRKSGRAPGRDRMFGNMHSSTFPDTAQLQATAGGQGQRHDWLGGMAGVGAGGLKLSAGGSFKAADGDRPFCEAARLGLVELIAGGAAAHEAMADLGVEGWCR